MVPLATSTAIDGGLDVAFPLAVGRCPTAIGKAAVFSHGFCCAESAVAAGLLERARETGAPTVGGLLALGPGA